METNEGFVRKRQTWTCFYPDRNRLKMRDKMRIMEVAGSRLMETGGEKNKGRDRKDDFVKGLPHYL